MNNTIRYSAFLFFYFFLTSCTYLKYSAVQSKYSKTQRVSPSQSNLKHLLDKETFFVFGKVVDDLNQYANVPLAVTAFSSKYIANELVDNMFSYGPGTHYGFNLPEGEYILQVYADINKDKVFDQFELVGSKKVVLNKQLYPEKVVGQADINIFEATKAIQAISISNIRDAVKAQSLFYPAGTIRQLHDPVFDNKISTLGLYDPASFLEHAPIMFYALEESVMHKVPVIFVHGIEGTPRSFEAILASLDRERFTPWFFYYPSGGDLNQLSDLFYRLFLSGKVIPMGDMPMVIVAHSMGGLVAREALNKYKGAEKENKATLFVSIASPFGGHPSAALGEKSGLMKLPVWADLNPNNQFIKKLYRKPLPDFLQHHLFYAYKNDKLFKFFENSDGVVPLSSQLHLEVQQQSNHKFGFNDNHVDILKNKDMIFRLMSSINSVKNIFPESSLNILVDGGFDVKVKDGYSPATRHLLQYAGKYFVRVSHGLIQHPVQGRFIQAIQGKVPPITIVEKEFLRFMRENPDKVQLALKD